MHYLPYSTTKEDKLIEEIGDWIDPYIIGAAIVESLHEQLGTATIATAKDLWYRALQRLPEVFSDIARWLPDPELD